MTTSKRKNYNRERRKARRNNKMGYTTMRICRCGWGGGIHRIGRFERLELMDNQTIS